MGRRSVCDPFDAAAIVERIVTGETTAADAYRRYAASAARPCAGATFAQKLTLAIAERLAKADPGNAGWQRDLSVSHERIGEVQQAQGDLAAALTSYQASLAIAERLAKADPGNAGWGARPRLHVLDREPRDAASSRLSAPGAAA